MPDVRAVATFRSSRNPDVLYHVEQARESDREWGALYCTCPGFEHRRSCAHVIAAERWRAFGMPDPDGDGGHHQPLPPPVPWIIVEVSQPGPEVEAVVRWEGEAPDAAS